LNA
jgi:predicted ATPase